MSWLLERWKLPLSSVAAVVGVIAAAGEYAKLRVAGGRKMKAREWTEWAVISAVFAAMTELILVKITGIPGITGQPTPLQRSIALSLSALAGYVAALTLTSGGRAGGSASGSGTSGAAIDPAQVSVMVGIVTGLAFYLAILAVTHPLSGN